MRDEFEWICLEEPHLKEFPLWIKLSSYKVVLIFTFDRERKDAPFFWPVLEPFWEENVFELNEGFVKFLFGRVLFEK